MQKLSFSSQEKRIFAGCFFSYLLVYVARMNLSGALPRLSQAFALTDAQSGLIQTVFAVVYAAGQLVNGILADHVSPRRHVVLGLLGSAACNLLFSLAGAYWQLLVLWGLNGVAQSMLWTPIVRLIAVWFEGKKRDVVSFFMCICFILGHLLAWAISGLMAAWFSWRASFQVPAAILLCTAVFALLTLRDRQHAVDAQKEGPGPMPLKQVLFGTGLWLILLGCVATGFARDGVMTWAPTLIGRLFSDGGDASGVAVSLLIPLMNLFGLLLGQAMLSRSSGGLRRTICRLLVAAAAAAALLGILSAPSALITALLLGVLCSLMYSVSNMQNVLVPMEYAYTGRVSLIAGISDCMIYVGTSVVSVASGALLQSLGQSAVYFSWAAAALLSCLLTLLAGRGSGKKAHSA